MAMRVRRSPFAEQGSGNGFGSASGPFGQGPSQGLIGAPQPPGPAAPAPSSSSSSAAFDFDGWGDEPDATPAKPAPTSFGKVLPPVPQPWAVQPQTVAGQPHISQPFAQSQAQQPMTQPTMQPTMQPQTVADQPHISQPFAQSQAQQPMTQPMMQPQGPMAASLLNAGLGAMGGAVGLNEAMASNMAAAAAMQLTSKMEGAGVTGWFPNTFNMIHSSFNVGHSYVLRKLLILLCPFIKRNQGAPEANTHVLWMQGGEATPNNDMGPESLKSNVEEPDLYIPLMSYMTYILVYGMQRGLVSEFSPEVISSTASFALVLLVLEAGSAKMGFYIAGSTVPIINLVANCGYKFAPIVLIVIIRILTGSNPIYYVFFAYFAACAAWTNRRFMLHFEPSQLKEQYGVAPSRLHKHIILGLALAQVPLCWLLTPSTRTAAAVAAAVK